MRLLYGFGIRCLFALMWVASLFHKKAKKWIDGRKTSLESFEIPVGREVFWFHCASLGEFDQGLPVMNALKETYPNCFLVVTFFSPSGMEFYNKRQHQVDLALYLPLDTKRKATRFVAHIRPTRVFFVKYEFWYNHLKAARRSGAKIYGVSSLFRPTHRFFKWYGGFFRDALRLFDHFYTQDERSKELLHSIGIEQATVTGDTRFDRMLAVKRRNDENEKIAHFAGDEPVLLMGSSWPIDEELLLPALLDLLSKYKIIIAPHDISELHVEAIAAYFKNDVVRYTNYQDNANASRVLILDTIGQLTSAYRYAQVAYVGGGFTGKLHNILEPGAFGIPVIFGPKFDRFPEAQLFIDQKVGYTISSLETFKTAFQHAVLHQADVRDRLLGLFQLNAGAAQKVVQEMQMGEKK